MLFNAQYLYKYRIKALDKSRMERIGGFLVRVPSRKFRSRRPRRAKPSVSSIDNFNHLFSRVTPRPELHPPCVDAKGWFMKREKWGCPLGWPVAIKNGVGESDGARWRVREQITQLDVGHRAYFVSAKTEARKVDRLVMVFYAKVVDKGNREIFQ